MEQTQAEKIAERKAELEEDKKKKKEAEKPLPFKVAKPKKKR